MYWHIPAIKFGRRIMRNTNGLIGRYPEADGMKTGFICASGFNVVATATRNGRKLIVVVFGSTSGMTRSEKAAQLFEKGFASGGLSWLMPSLGTVDALQPVAAAPPNLRDDMCGGHRRRPAADVAEGEEAPGNSDTDSSSAYAMTANSLRDRGPRGSFLGPMQAFAPIPVYIGPARKPGEAIEVAEQPKREKKKATATAAVAPKEKEKKTISEVPAPATANAAGFSLTPSLKLPGTGTFAPASASEKPVAAPDPAKKDATPKPKKTAAKPAPKADAKADTPSAKQ
jgi:D-alanyl-D-alanine carboxypeptidase